ncbi:MAG: sugar transporter [Paracoccus sp. (in: a-proteobacteria)]|nr:sugar transporter [Paracoccus sp. (in: a-proteobacteria)]
MLVLSFLLLVAAPIAATAWYLWARAADQYASYIGFSVRSESGASASDLLGGLAALSSNSSSDTDILYKYIQSHDIVARIDERLDLRAIWSRHSDTDPVFGYWGSSNPEDLLENWERKVNVYYDTGMLDIRVKAFDADDAYAIAQAIVEESTRRVNELSDLARADAIRYAQVELDGALERLRNSRRQMTEFRNRHQIVDPTADAAAQMGVVTSLQGQLAEALIQQGLMRQNAASGDPRLEQARLRVQVIQEQIDEERRKIGAETGSGGQMLSEVVGEYEVLAVDRAFAEQAYVAAMASYDNAQANAARQTRYLATYLNPTRPETPEYPARVRLLGLISGFILVLWFIGVLVFYSVRDRR